MAKVVMVVMVVMMVVVVVVTVVVASEPPRLCKPGEWSDNAATRFTVLYHPFCLSPLYSWSLARVLAPFHTICNFPASLVFPLRILHPKATAALLFLLSYLQPRGLFISSMRFVAVAFPADACLEANSRGAIVAKRANRNARNDTSS